MAWRGWSTWWRCVFLGSAVFREERFFQLFAHLPSLLPLQTLAHVPVTLADGTAAWAPGTHLMASPGQASEDDEDRATIALTPAGATAPVASLSAPAAAATALTSHAAPRANRPAPIALIASTSSGSPAVAVCLTRAAVAPRPTHPSALAQPSPADRAVLAVLAWLGPEDDGDAASLPYPADVAGVYAATAPPTDARALASPPPGLLPQLRPYQSRAVAWMIDRETGTGLALPPAGATHPLWERVPTVAMVEGGKQHPPLYVNASTGRITDAAFAAPPPPCGGALCDEMGLGKSVELMALLLARPPPKREAVAPRVPTPPRGTLECSCGATGPVPRTKVAVCTDCGHASHLACVGMKRAPAAVWRCGGCAAAHAAAPPPGGLAPTTLIVCPSHIVAQWVAELSRHAAPGSLRIAVYAGQGGGGGGAPPPPAGPDVPTLGGTPRAPVVGPSDLAAFDVVITSYDALARDVHHAPPPADSAAASRSLRAPKRYAVLATPLTGATWWRLVVDEAQEIEGGVSGAARLAAAIASKHRWAVTGTPMSTSADDAAGLLTFLNVDPWGVPAHWRRATSSGDAGARRCLVAALSPSLGGVLWRSSKAAVAHELVLPPQTAVDTAVTMSAIERMFYDDQHALVAARARATRSRPPCWPPLRQATTAP